MEGVLWYLLASSRGGPTRIRLLRSLQDRPRNANQLATELELDYTTVRYHLDVLMDNNVLRRAGDDYGTVYLFTEQARTNWTTVEEILEAVDADTTDDADETDDASRTDGSGSTRDMEDR